MMLIGAAYLRAQNCAEVQKKSVMFALHYILAIRWGICHLAEQEILICMTYVLQNAKYSWNMESTCLKKILILMARFKTICIYHTTGQRLKLHFLIYHEIFYWTFNIGWDKSSENSSENVWHGCTKVEMLHFMKASVEGKLFNNWKQLTFPQLKKNEKKKSMSDWGSISMFESICK